MREFRSLAIAATLAVSASGAQAAMVQETYDFTSAIPGSYFDSLEVTSDQGNTVTVTMGTYGDGWDDGPSTGAQGGGKVGQWKGWGLGACSDPSDPGCAEDHRVDGKDVNEMLVFKFAMDVVLDSITFGAFEDCFYFDYSTANGDEYLDRNFGADGVYEAGGQAIGDGLNVGAWWSKAAFKIRSITVSYQDPNPVPLPAAGWMLIAGMGGLAALRRKRART